MRENPRQCDLCALPRCQLTQSTVPDAPPRIEGGIMDQWRRKFSAFSHRSAESAAEPQVGVNSVGNYAMRSESPPPLLPFGKCHFIPRSSHHCPRPTTDVTRLADARHMKLTKSTKISVVVPRSTKKPHSLFVTPGFDFRWTTLPTLFCFGIG